MAYKVLMTYHAEYIVIVDADSADAAVDAAYNNAPELCCSCTAQGLALDVTDPVSTDAEIVQD